MMKRLDRARGMTKDRIMDPYRTPTTKSLVVDADQGLFEHTY